MAAEARHPTSWEGDTTKCDLVDGILTVVLNRPERLNLFSPRMRDELIAAFDCADQDDRVRAVVVTGAGRVFCAGGEVTPLPAAPTGSSDQISEDDGAQVTLRIFRCLKPVIGAINGAAVGFGATLPLAMDVRLAADKARFGFVFAGLGGVPEGCSSWFLPRLVGISRAIEWCLRSELISADEAQQGGLVHSIHSGEDLLDQAYALARRLTQKAAPVSVALVRQMMWRLSAAEHPMAANRVESLMVHGRKSANDMREGIDSFLNKRSPVFPDLVSRDLPAGFPWWTEPRFSDD